MECWNIGHEVKLCAHNGLKTHDFCVWIKGFGINFHYFSMNVLICSRDNYSFMAIMTLPDKWLSLFDAKEPLKAQNTTLWDTPYVPTKCALAADPIEWYPHSVIILVVAKQEEC